MEHLDISTFTIAAWAIAITAAFCIGVAKGGVGGVAMFALVMFAYVMPAKLSVGAVLPLLVAGDILAVWFFRKHAKLTHVWRLLPAAVVGVTIGAFLLSRIPSTVFKPFIGVLILALIGLQVWRTRVTAGKTVVAATEETPKSAPTGATAQEVPHNPAFSWTMGILAGVATMLGNAAGGVMTIYLLATKLEKKVFVGTSAVFFFIINVTKTPFSAAAGALTRETLLLDAFLVPVVWIGFFLGKFVLSKMSQKVFERWMLGGTALAAVFLIVKK